MYTNDIANYSETLNNCYLSNIDDDKIKKIEKYIEKANKYADDKNILKNISGNCTFRKIKDDTRIYFTEENTKE